MTYQFIAFSHSQDGARAACKQRLRLDVESGPCKNKVTKHWTSVEPCSYLARTRKHTQSVCLGEQVCMRAFFSFFFLTILEL